MEKELIGALVGLARTCETNPRTEDAEMLAVNGLSLLNNLSGSDNINLKQLTDKVNAEKNVISPGCASCEHPCGHNDNYDMENIFKAEEDVKKAKLDILTAIEKLADDMKNSAAEADAGKLDLIFRELSVIGEEVSLEFLENELKNIKKVS